MWLSDGFFHSVAGEGVADDFLGIVGDVAEGPVEGDFVVAALYDGGAEAELDGPFLCFQDDLRTKSLVAILREDDDAAEHHSLFVDGIEAAGGHWQVVVDDDDVLRLGRVVFVELHVEGNLMLPGHCLNADIVGAGLLCCFGCSEEDHEFSARSAK